MVSYLNSWRHYGLLSLFVDVVFPLGTFWGFFFFAPCFGPSFLFFFHNLLLLFARSLHFSFFSLFFSPLSLSLSYLVSRTPQQCASHVVHSNLSFFGVRERHSTTMVFVFLLLTLQLALWEVATDVSRHGVVVWFALALSEMTSVRGAYRKTIWWIMKKKQKREKKRVVGVAFGENSYFKSKRKKGVTGSHNYLDDDIVFVLILMMICFFVAHDNWKRLPVGTSRSNSLEPFATVSAGVFFPTATATLTTLNRSKPPYKICPAQ